MSINVFSRDDKYTIVSEILRNASGTLLDVGARDRVLYDYLEAGKIQYFSSDLGNGHDYKINLEEKLPLPDQSIDYVIALDVLEHVEHIHNAFHELARISKRKLIIALPNMATLSKRWSFFLKGYLGTQKYDLYPEHQGDRHRWFTIYPEIHEFIEHHCHEAGLDLDAVHEELEKNLLARVALILSSIGINTKGLFTDRCIFVMSRAGGG